MSSADLPPEEYGDVQALMALGVALDRLGAHDVRDLIEAVVLTRAFPRWAIWRPIAGGVWTAVRPASSRSPGPELPMVWMQAATAGELAELMRRAEGQVAPRGGQPGWP